MAEPASLPTNEPSASTMGIDLEQVASFVTVQPMTRAVREYRAALRSNASP